MTGQGALVALVVDRMKVRHTSWPDSHYLTVGTDVSGQDWIMDQDGDRFSVFSFAWRPGDEWEFYHAPCSLSELFRFLGPGKCARSSSLPGVKIVLSESGSLIHHNGSNLELTDELLKAKFYIYPAGVELVSSREEMLK